MNHTMSATTEQIAFPIRASRIVKILPYQAVFLLAKKLYKLMVNILFSLKLRALEWFLPQVPAIFISVFKLWSEQFFMSLEHLADITIYDAESPVQSPTVGCCCFFSWPSAGCLKLVYTFPTSLMCCSWQTRGPLWGLGAEAGTVALPCRLAPWCSFYLGWGSPGIWSEPSCLWEDREAGARGGPCKVHKVKT